MISSCTFSMFRPNQILPSYLNRRISGSGGAMGKRAKTIISWDRDIICLPKQLITIFLTFMEHVKDLQWNS